MRSSILTMQVVSSITTTAPEPSIEPALFSESKSIVQPIITSPGSTGAEEPPGITALSLRPFHTPPAISSSSLNGVPSGTSKLLVFNESATTEKILVPPLLGLPSSANHLPPLSMMLGTEAKVSVLLTVVGRPKAPYTAGNGGLKRGMPFLPSSDSSSAVSSPQM